MVTYNDELSIQPSSPADALAKLASYDKAWITYLFCLGSLALCILLGAGQARSMIHHVITHLEAK